MSAKFYGLCGIRLEEMVKLYEMLRAAGRVHESEERDQLREAKKHYERVFPEPDNKWGKYIALKNGRWGWLDENGRYTQNKRKACCSYYEDDEK